MSIIDHFATMPRSSLVLCFVRRGDVITMFFFLM